MSKTHRQLERPDPHVVLDPEHWEREAREHLTRWLDVLLDMRLYGRELMLRLMGKRPWKMPEIVSISVLYRQALLSFDAVVLSLEHGASDAAMVQARALFEASLYLDWLEQKGRDHWSRMCYVSSLRQRLYWSRRSISGTEEHAEFAASHGPGDTPLVRSAQEVEAARADVARVEEFLTGESYREYNQRFETLVSARRVRAEQQKRKWSPAAGEPFWYEPGGVPNIAAMATQLQRKHQYLTSYKYLSYFTHASFLDSHGRAIEEGWATEPVRRLDSFPTAFLAACGSFLAALETVLRMHRAEELEQFARVRRTRWAEAMQNPPQLRFEEEFRRL